MKWFVLESLCHGVCDSDINRILTRYAWLCFPTVSPKSTYDRRRRRERQKSLIKEQEESTSKDISNAVAEHMRKQQSEEVLPSSAEISSERRRRYRRSRGQDSSASSVDGGVEGGNLSSVDGVVRTTIANSRKISRESENADSDTSHRTMTGSRYNSGRDSDQRTTIANSRKISRESENGDSDSSHRTMTGSRYNSGRDSDQSSDSSRTLTTNLHSSRDSDSSQNSNSYRQNKEPENKEDNKTLHRDMKKEPDLNHLDENRARYNRNNNENESTLTHVDDSKSRYNRNRENEDSTPPSSIRTRRLGRDHGAYVSNIIANSYNNKDNVTNGYDSWVGSLRSGSGSNRDQIPESQVTTSNSQLIVADKDPPRTGLENSSKTDALSNTLHKQQLLQEEENKNQNNVSNNNKNRNSVDGDNISLASTSSGCSSSSSTANLTGGSTAENTTLKPTSVSSLSDLEATIGKNTLQPTLLSVVFATSTMGLLFFLSSFKLYLV